MSSGCRRNAESAIRKALVVGGGATGCATAILLARAVVDASVQLAQWPLDRDQGDVPGPVARIASLVKEPA
jgi:cation diffusion facilitator CzcD-associated flavoprotein CzcO